MLTLTDNYFQLFALSPGFSLDSNALDQAFRAIQAQVHPDKFANASEAEKRRAMQWATHVNAAYQTLKKPLQRAIYLCELAGQSLEIESNTAMPAVFLMQQMEWREALEEAREQKNVTALTALAKEVEQARQVVQKTVAQALDESQDYVLAAQSIRQWLFIEKMRTDIHTSLEAFD